MNWSKKVGKKRELKRTLSAELYRICSSGYCIHTEQMFQLVWIEDRTEQLINKAEKGELNGEALSRLNFTLLQAAYPYELTKQKAKQNFLIWSFSIFILALIATFILAYMNMHPHRIASKHLDSNQLLYESTAILGVSVAIIVAGLTVAAPLYISLWQSLTDSLFQVFLVVNNAYVKPPEGCDKEELKRLRNQARASLVELRNKIEPTREKFTWMLRMAIFLLVALFTVILAPSQEYSYYVATASILPALGLAIGFVRLIRNIQKLRPVPKKLDIQVRLATCLNSQNEYRPRPDSEEKTPVERSEPQNPPAVITEPSSQTHTLPIVSDLESINQAGSSHRITATGLGLLIISLMAVGVVKELAKKDKG